MDETLTWVWLIAGVVLILSELALPGLVSLFLGAAAVLVAGLRWVGLIETLTASLFAWMGLSIGLTLGLRKTVQRLLPSETSKRSVDEHASAIGTEVEVVQTVTEDDASGRIRFQGTSWPATSTNGVLPVGSKARLVVRDDLVWLVEAADPLAIATAALDAPKPGD